jgi:hypothetical protein
MLHLQLLPTSVFYTVWLHATIRYDEHQEPAGSGGTMALPSQARRGAA